MLFTNNYRYYFHLWLMLLVSLIARAASDKLITAI